MSLVLLILASQRIEDIMGWDLDTDTTKASLQDTPATIFQTENIQLKSVPASSLSCEDCYQRGSLPSPVEYCILAWVAGLIWSEIKQLWDVGLKEYASDLWNVVDFITNSLYVATIGLRVRAFCDVSRLLLSGDVNHKTQQSNLTLFVLPIF